LAGINQSKYQQSSVMVKKNYVSKQKKFEVRQMSTEKLKGIVKGHYRYIGFAMTEGDWSQIRRDAPIVDYMKIVIKQREKREAKATQDK
jgi:hypothetical protein